MDVNEIRRINARALRDGAKMNQKEFAEKVGISESHASQLIGARAGTKVGDRIFNISHGKARQIEAAFGKSHGWLDRIDDQVREKPAQYDPSLPPDALEIAKRYAEATPEVKAVVSWMVTHSENGQRSLADFMAKPMPEVRRRAHEKSIEKYQKKKRATKPKAR